MIDQIKLLLYFDKRRILDNMKTACEAVLETFSEEMIRKFPPIRYILQVDVMDLLNFFPNIGTYLLSEPLKLQQMANEILFACIKATDSSFNENIRLAQIAVSIRLKNIPKIVREPNKHKYNGVVVYFGLLIGISNTTNYVIHTVWSCPEQCDENEVILQYIPKVPPKCYVCRSVLFENSGFRCCGEQVTATFKVEKDLHSKKFIITDDLIKLLKLGSTYFIHAVVLKKMTEVWYLEEPFYLARAITSILTDLQKLYKECGGLPWKFLYSLASHIGSQICPLNTFMNLKINLLLSIASVKSHLLIGSNILNVLASGYDTGYVGLLMASAANLADRNTALGTSNTSVPTALLAASGGVCFLQLPFHFYSQKQYYLILSTLETGEIIHSNTKTSLKCAVWAHGINFKKTDFDNVSSIFGTVCRGDYNEFDNELSEHILQQAIEPVKINHKEIETLRNLKFYLDVTANIKVTIDLEAENLLRNYFLAARKERPKCVSVGSMNALIATCMMSAKLCRRSVANCTDAIFTVWLHVSGMSEPRIAPDEYLDTPADINNLQKVIIQFKSWLEVFTGYHISYSQ